MSAPNQHPSALGASPDPSDSEAVNLNNILATSTDDDDDDDMDYEPAFDELDSDGEYEDAPEDQAESELEFDFGPGPGGQLAFLTQIIAADMTAHEQAPTYQQMLVEENENEDEGDDEDMDEDDEDEDDENEEPEHQQGTTADRPFLLSREQLMRVLGATGFQNVLRSHSRGGWGVFASREETGRPGRQSRLEPRLEPVPNEEGRDLMMSGTFGNNERRPNNRMRAKRAAWRVLEREIGGGGLGREKSGMRLLKQDLIPESDGADAIIHYKSRCYSGQFSADGNFFFSCGQDFKVRMYDTSNPYSWKYYKSLDMPYGQWTITDGSLSADNRFLAYSSMAHIVCLASTDLLDDTPPRTLDFTRLTSARISRQYRGFAIWSVRFSGDGRELVAGSGDDSVYVFDIERNKTILRIPGHNDDVNAVCFGDVNSPHILYSGSDDTTLKVWDRRSMGDGRAAGVFLGHTEGLTYVDSKGDGRYIISNGKDQTAKLWDLRKVIPTEKADSIDPNAYTQGWNYSRGGPFDINRWRPHPHDCSLVTFRGHSVEKTLIRCHFSPQGSSDGRYVYSGSQDGKVYIWNLDATLKGTIDVAAATRYLRGRGRESFDPYWGGQGQFRTVVRDASWHPAVPMIAATAWNGWGTALGTCSIHSWNEGLDSDEALQKKGLRLDAKLRMDQQEEEMQPRRHIHFVT